jgi:hypothetical protein
VRYILSSLVYLPRSDEAQTKRDESTNPVSAIKTNPYEMTLIYKKTNLKTYRNTKTDLGSMPTDQIISDEPQLCPGFGPLALARHSPTWYYVHPPLVKDGPSDLVTI